jgi:hypothetical protein
MKRLSTEAVHQNLVVTLGPEAIAYSTVMWYLRTPKFVGQNEGAYDEAELMGIDQVDEAIMKDFGDNPFSSMRELSRLTCLITSTGHRHLTESLGLTVRRLRWVSHRLTDDQKTIRVNLSRERL